MNSIDTANAAQAPNTAIDASAREVDRLGQTAPSNRQASGTNSRTLATQSERWPVRKSSQGAFLNAEHRVRERKRRYPYGNKAAVEDEQQVGERDNRQQSTRCHAGGAALNACGGELSGMGRS